MSDALGKDYAQEYWRPAQAPTAEFVAAPATSYCAECGTQYAVGARFCHVCGTARAADLRSRFHQHWIDRIDLEAARNALGLNTTSLVCLGLAAVCLLAAILTGVLYSASTLTEWQAVQTWRIEWLLACAVLLIAAILFKRELPDKSS
ncbi:MAG TPA: hypothetical protein VMU24_12240 [Candidatus Acidoferrales bacterium]|nr:hypothetical protein [Candidatus Acidoferrales bacterium]